jgi:hypothetical protein
MRVRGIGQRKSLADIDDELPSFDPFE